LSPSGDTSRCFPAVQRGGVRCSIQHELKRLGTTPSAFLVWFVVLYASIKVAPHIPSEAPLLFVGWTLTAIVVSSPSRTAAIARRYHSEHVLGTVRLTAGRRKTTLATTDAHLFSSGGANVDPR
jgi:hypothetical protein